MGVASGVSASLIPSVCRIVRAFPIWQVSLPFSRSMTNRRPVPEVSQILLRYAQLLPGVADDLAEVLGRISTLRELILILYSNSVLMLSLPIYF